MRKILALSFAVVIFLAASAMTFGSPPTSAKEKPAVVQTTQAVDAQQVSPIVVQHIDLAVSMPVECVTENGEIAKAIRYERRKASRPDSLYEDWISDVATPPNEITYNGFANTRAREQV